ncbi:DUF805 domain-containing protein [Martelella soudanensis]|uniref:DUF805 domain-containing protein n=1 Tax=unclassified Martelella TaxID=2629616 RepID=UPI0015DEC21C|nr:MULTISPECIES: DUF805 domain-containing protein [unclassified Martelella]
MSDSSIIGRDHRNVGFVEALQLAFRNYFLFSGRSSRGAFWFWVLWTLIISIVLSAVDSILFGSARVGFFGGIWNLVTFIPGIAIGARRLHDVNRSGWWQLIGITVIGLLVLLYWFVKPGQEQTNDFGPDAEAGRD